jgi:hypothetical protein
MIKPPVPIADRLIAVLSISKAKGGKSYVVFGKTDNSAINLSAIASGETEVPLQSFVCSPLMTKPPVPIEVKKTAHKPSYLPLLMAQGALSLTARIRVITVVAQSPVQVMSTVMA